MNYRMINSQKITLTIINNIMNKFPAKSKIFNYLIWSISLILVYMLSGIIFNGEHIWMSMTVQIATIIVTYLYIEINKPKLISGFINIILPLITLLWIPSLFFGNSYRLVWIYLLMVPLLYVVTWLLHSRKLIFYLILLIFPVITSLLIFPNLISYSQSLNIKTGTQFPNIKFVDSNRKSFKIEKDKIILLDFWSTKCGICYKKFPDLERLYHKYKDNKGIQIYSVHVPYPQDNFNSTVKLVKKLNYKFPTLFAVSKNETMEKLNFNGFPHYIIIQNDKIVYSGFFQIDKDIIIGNSEREIDQLVKINE